MRVEKRVLNDALRVLGNVVCQTSPVELYRSIRFVGDANGVMAMATDGVEVVSVILDAFAETEIDFCVPFKDQEKSTFGHVYNVDTWLNTLLVYSMQVVLKYLFYQMESSGNLTKNSIKTNLLTAIYNQNYNIFSIKFFRRKSIFF